MKIAIVTENFLPSTDGVVTRLCATIRWLQDHGHQVTIIAPQSDLDEFYGAKIEGIPSRPFFLYRNMRIAMPCRKVGAVLHRVQPDVLHVVNPVLLGVAGIYYGRKLRLPMVASYHTHIPKYADYYRLPFLKPLLWRWIRMLHNKADLNLCTSRAVMAELTNRKFRNVCIWERGVDTRLFGPHHRDARMRSVLSGGRTDSVVLLYAGRLAAEKGIEKIREVLDSSPEFCLALVGDGPHRASLEKHFHGTNTVFTGFLHGEELARAYASADIFVFPSETETLGLVILEAMASGLPVVACRNGPLSEQIEDGVTGILYDPLRPGGLTQAVGRLLDKQLRERISRQAHQLACKHNWSAPSEQLMGYYQEVLARHGMQD